ncbi:leucine-rich repeat-containing protein 4B [Leptopilina heterotoma]|uniref:leucine-rich repeat-containing protein 4B n=1 Tax=Leptopilina heterotoma TaxID=63436 RepID=UPI001CA951B6|nr:leucine-rich repeat-containing protein 4B [Leptopilina heterotoma]
MDLLLLLTISSLYCFAFGDKCASECSCKWKGGKRTVECTDRHLASIPDSIDPETQVLDISGNLIKTLPENIFVKVYLTNLQRLYLRECRIDHIDDNALSGLTNLVELDLSGNQLKAVPSQSFAKAPFLRDVVLAGNPLERIPSFAFKKTPNLVKLDLSNTKLIELQENAFLGLENLESLRLNNNKLSTLQQGTLHPLNKLRSIELHENPWFCDCHLRELKICLIKHNIPTLIAPVCHGPEQNLNKMFTELVVEDFACQPVLLITSQYAEATIGENASIICRVSAVPPAKIKWYWNGRLLANHSAFSSYQKVLIYEEGQFRKRSTLVLTNAQESDSSEFFCVAENRAGSVEANFTLHVSLRTAGMSTLGSGQIAGISAALVVLILFILLIILVLFLRLRRMPQKDHKSPTPAEVVPPENVDNVQSATSTISRRKHEEVETTSFSETKHPVSLNLSYVQRPQPRLDEGEYMVKRFEDNQPMIPGPCFSSTTSLMPIDNPDLIRDTRRGSGEEVVLPYNGEYSRVELEDAKLLYSGCLWERDVRTTVSVNPYTSKEMLANMASVEAFPPGAKQMRVWQKGVPVLPPVSALKRVLGSTRSSPDEGYQEGTGTDV